MAAVEIPPIEVEPRNVHFKGPFTERTVSKHVIKNTNPDHKVAVKIKTSEVQQFRLAPVYAFIDPAAQIDLTIICKPFDYNPDGNYGSHRMVILYTAVPPDYEGTAEVFWKEVAQRWRDVKMPVRYEQGEAAAAAPAGPPQPPAMSEAGAQPTQVEGTAPVEQTGAVQGSDATGGGNATGAI